MGNDKSIKRGQGVCQGLKNERNTIIQAKPKRKNKKTQDFPSTILISSSVNP